MGQLTTRYAVLVRQPGNELVHDARRARNDAEFLLCLRLDPPRTEQVHRNVESPSRNPDKNSLDFEKICIRFAYGFLQTEITINNIS